MDNITFEKVWQDENLIELKVSSNSNFISVYQNCYIEGSNLAQLADKMIDYINHYPQTCYLEFGNKRGNYTPAFSMKIIPVDYSGHLKIEMDFEIDDNDTRSHRAMFFVKSELGLVEQLGKDLKTLVNAQLKSTVSLLQEL